MSRVVLAGMAAALIPSGALAAGPVDWNRTYVGVQVGGAGLRSNWSVSDYGVGEQDASLSDTGFAGGLFVGHDFQWNGLVFGAEADFNFMDLSGSQTWLEGGEGLTVKTSLENAASVRARLGIPWQNMLFYATGGVAFGSVKASYDVNSSLKVGTDDKDFDPGFVGGAGVEARITNRMTLRLQGLYYNFGSTKFADIDGYGSTYKADADAWVGTIGATWQW